MWCLNENSVYILDLSITKVLVFLLMKTKITTSFMKMCSKREIPAAP